MEDETDEQLRKRERVTKLKQLSYRIGNANVSDMEKEPAFKRRNIKLDSVPHSSESRYQIYIKQQEDKKQIVKPFLRQRRLIKISCKPF